jgi:hypothetical protein
MRTTTTAGTATVTAIEEVGEAAVETTVTSVQMTTDVRDTAISQLNLVLSALKQPPTPTLLRLRRGDLLRPPLHPTRQLPDRVLALLPSPLR